VGEGGRLPRRPGGGLPRRLGGGEFADDPAEAPGVQQWAAVADCGAQPGLQVAGQVEQLGEGALRLAAGAEDVDAERQPGQHHHQRLGGAACQGGPGDRNQVGRVERQAERAWGDVVADREGAVPPQPVQRVVGHQQAGLGVLPPRQLDAAGRPARQEERVGCDQRGWNQHGEQRRVKDGVGVRRSRDHHRASGVRGRQALMERRPPLNRKACDEEAVVGRLRQHDRQAHATAAQRGLKGAAAQWGGLRGWWVPWMVHDSAKSLGMPHVRRTWRTAMAASTRAAAGSREDAVAIQTRVRELGRHGATRASRTPVVCRTRRVPPVRGRPRPAAGDRGHLRYGATA
jgi:hypothetical protein